VRVCEHCRADISHKRGNARFCSRSCKGRARHAAKGLPPRSKGGTCAVPQCSRPWKAQQLCPRHYQRFLKYGDPLTTKGHDPTDAARTCLACKADISHKRSNAVYCNRSCKMAGWHAANRATPEGRAREKNRNTERYQRESKRRKASAKTHYWNTRDLRVQYSREWRKENPHRRRDQADRRAFLMVTNADFVPFGLAEWEKLQRQYGYRCAYCGMKPEKLEKDHVIPLTRGGRHAIANILPACKSCNISKYDYFLAEWRLRPQGR
jgi:hypothetical protein